MKLLRRPKRIRRALIQARMNRSGSTGAIHLEQVQTRYHPDDPPVLNGFNLQVQDGEIVCLLGPSGVGKTTALRVIAGFERVINGYVRLGGRLVGSPFLHIPPHERALGLVFQSYALFPHLTVVSERAIRHQGCGRRGETATVFRNSGDVWDQRLRGSRSPRAVRRGAAEGGTGEGDRARFRGRSAR